MSTREQKKQKRKEQRRIKKRKKQLDKEKQEQLKELNNLEAEAETLKEKIKETKKNNSKKLTIRNLKIFRKTCNLLVPFVIISGLVAGGWYAFTGELPVHTDKTTKYLLHNVEYTTNETLSINNTYQRARWNDDKPKSNLTIYTPWFYDEENNIYTRSKRVYTINANEELTQAILDNNYGYILDHLTNYKEEIEKTNIDIDLENNPYYYNADLNYFDKNQSITYTETEKHNIIVTLAEILIVLAGGGLITHFRNLEYGFELETINDNYKNSIEDIQPMMEELENMNQKILTLSQKDGK